MKLAFPKQPKKATQLYIRKEVVIIYIVISALLVVLNIFFVFENRILEQDIRLYRTMSGYVE